MSSDTNNSNKWEQKYIKYKLKYNAIKKELEALIGGGPFIPSYKQCFDLCINYELVDKKFAQAIFASSSVLINDETTYSWNSISPMYISLLDLYFNKEHKTYQDFLKSNKGKIPSNEDIKSKLEKCVKDKFNGLKLSNNKDKPVFESTGDQDLFLSACFKLSGNPSQVFNQLVENVVKIFSLGKNFTKREYNVNGKKIIGLLVDNNEFACYQKFTEENFNCVHINLAKMNLEDYYNDIIDNSELKNKVNIDIVETIKLNKIPSIIPPNNNMETLFNTAIFASDNIWGSEIFTSSTNESQPNKTPIDLKAQQQMEHDKLNAEQKAQTAQLEARLKAEKEQELQREKQEDLQVQQKEKAPRKTPLTKEEIDKRREDSKNRRVERQKIQQAQKVQEKERKEKLRIQQKADKERLQVQQKH